MDVQYEGGAYSSGATILFIKVWGLAYGPTNGQSRGNQNFLDRWVDYFSKVMGLSSVQFSYASQYTITY